MKNFTDGHILNSFEPNGAKDVYRYQSDDGSTNVVVVFDFKISYRDAITKVFG